MLSHTKYSPCLKRSLFIILLDPKDFANIVALFGILGIVSNMSLPLVLESMGLRTFSLFAIFSSLLFPLATIFTNSYRLVLLAGCIGLYGGVQKVRICNLSLQSLQSQSITISFLSQIGTSSAMMSLANELSIPQGQLQGEKASMLALCKISSPIVYGWLYIKGKSFSSSSIVDGNAAQIIMSKIGSRMPFVLNLVLGILAFLLTWVSMG